ncbi:DUF3987 domain-containing protein [Marinobacter zhejiangensis]|uniref:DUF3987 domain-containing protein n=1 Tax=Marinobacter zhejiangensis TaxID=488535 RepID=UPI000B824B1F
MSSNWGTTSRWGLPAAPTLNLFERYQELPHPSRLGLLGEAVCHAGESVQTPYSTTLLVALTAASTVTQALCDVERPAGGPTSLSLFTLMIAGSGERKSSLIKYFFQPIREAEALAEQEYKSLSDKWEQEMHIWDLQRRVLEKALSNALRKSLTSNTQES